MVVGILKTLAALASATVLFFSTWRSIDCTPNAICGCWSMKMSWLFCGVRISSVLAMGVSSLGVDGSVAGRGGQVEQQHLGVEPAGEAERAPSPHPRTTPGP